MLVVGEEAVVKLYRARAIRADGFVEREKIITTRTGVSSFKGWVTQRQGWFGGLRLTVDVVDIPDDMWTRFLPEFEALSEKIHTASEEDLEQFRQLVNRLSEQVARAELQFILSDATAKVPG